MVEAWGIGLEARIRVQADFLKARQLRSLQEVLANLNGLWTYATTEWLRLTVPCGGDKTRTR